MGSRWLLTIGFIALSGLASSAWAAKSVEERRLELFSAYDGFLTYHPDVRFRELGMDAYREGRHDRALQRFERAARYADKPSQAMIAEMYWRGLGTAPDRVLGYIWMDLSAERGYPDFIRFRELYWEQLGPDERAQVAARAPEVLAVYGDEVARPRQELWLRRGLARATGSRTGYVAYLDVIVYDDQIGNEGLHGHQYYADVYWRANDYWRLQDRIWRLPVRERVDVGAPQTVKADD